MYIYAHTDDCFDACYYRRLALLIYLARMRER